MIIKIWVFMYLYTFIESNNSDSCLTKSDIHSVTIWKSIFFLLLILEYSSCLLMLKKNCLIIILTGKKHSKLLSNLTLSSYQQLLFINNFYSYVKWVCLDNSICALSWSLKSLYFWLIQLLLKEWSICR